jgi:hypothetical protein
MASFLSLELQLQSAVKMLNMQTMCSSIFRPENNKGLTAH